VGFAESLNISVSAAIMLQQLSGRVRSNSDIEWQLKEQDGKELLLKWMKCSIVDVENILKRQFK
ncbi:MAG: TrmH family RNA methyltransferase, partial [Mucinivorans sp.]